MDLTPRQRKFLKGLAHALEPVVRVGKGRVTDSLIRETNRSLDAHELIKVRIDGDDPKDRAAVAERLAAQTAAAIVGSIGKVAILFRPREEEPGIRLPK